MKCTPDPHENKQPASKDLFLLHGVIYKMRNANYYKNTFFVKCDPLLTFWHVFPFKCLRAPSGNWIFLWKFGLAVILRESPSAAWLTYVPCLMELFWHIYTAAFSFLENGWQYKMHWIILGLRYGHDLCSSVAWFVSSVTVVSTSSPPPYEE